MWQGFPPVFVLVRFLELCWILSSLFSHCGPADQSLDTSVYSTDHSGAPQVLVQCRDVEKNVKRWQMWKEAGVKLPYIERELWSLEQYLLIKNSLNLLCLKALCDFSKDVDLFGCLAFRTDLFVEDDSVLFC